MSVTTNRIIQVGDRKTLKVIPFPDYINDPEKLLYSGGGGRFFQSLPNDRVKDGLLWHGGNPLLLEEFSIKGCNNISVEVTSKKTYSQQKNVGLFTIDNGEYYWNNVTTNVLGIYTLIGTNSISDFNFYITSDRIFLRTNDVNSVPRVGDYLVINKINATTYDQQTIDNINSKFEPLPVLRNQFIEQTKILDVILVGGTGVNTVYAITIDKTFDLGVPNNLYSFVLLNRKNTSIQKDLFYKTFEMVEVHNKQLLGDPYNNTYNINLINGRSNYMNYKGNDALGYSNLIKEVIGNLNNDPIVILEINDEIKDRLSFKNNDYITKDIHFELHLPTIFNDEVDDFGKPRNLVAIARNTVDDESLGFYSEMYFTNNEFKRIGWVFNDLRIIIIDDSELVTALGYNSNRNFTIPAPEFIPEKRNGNTNEGVGIELFITGASNTSPIVITTSSPHNLTRGTRVYITGVLGNTSANGPHYIDTGDTLNTFKLYTVMPTYNQNNIMITPGTPVSGLSSYVDSPANPGRVLSAVPNYNYFYTYRIKTLQNDSVLPYSKTIDFNFTKNNVIDDSDDAALFIKIPRISTSDKVGNNTYFNKGFETHNFIDGYGIDIIIGTYTQDLNNPSIITGIKDIVFIPITELTVPFDAISQTIETGLQLQVLLSDYNTAKNNPDRKYDIKDITPVYTPTLNALSDNLLTGEGSWLIGNVIYKHEVEMNRANVLISVPANKWNSSTNPTFNSEENLEKKSKFITEIALYDKDDETKPVIYTKINPPIKKTNSLDLNIGLKIDF